MILRQLRPFLLVCSLLFCLFNTGCRTDQRDKNQQTDQQQTNQFSHKRHKKHHRHQQQADSLQQNQRSARVSVRADDVPAKVLEILTYVRQNNRAPNGFVGGRTFGNFENHLPKQDASNQRIRYQEWDVNPKVQGRSRGVERLITGSDNRAYYTPDHYNTFTEIK